MAAAAELEFVQGIGRMNKAEASASCKRGSGRIYGYCRLGCSPAQGKFDSWIRHCRSGLIKINGYPIEVLDPEFLRQKANEIITRIGRSHFAGVDMEVEVRGGRCLTSKAYAIRQAIANALVAFYRNYVNDRSKMKEITDKIARFDRSLLVADPNKLGG